MKKDNKMTIPRKIGLGLILLSILNSQIIGWRWAVDKIVPSHFWILGFFTALVGFLLYADIVYFVK